MGLIPDIWQIFWHWIIPLGLLLSFICGFLLRAASIRFVHLIPVCGATDPINAGYFGHFRHFRHFWLLSSWDSAIFVWIDLPSGSYQTFFSILRLPVCKWAVTSRILGLLSLYRYANEPSLLSWLGRYFQSSFQRNQRHLDATDRFGRLVGVLTNRLVISTCSQIELNWKSLVVCKGAVLWRHRPSATESAQRALIRRRWAV